MAAAAVATAAVERCRLPDAAGRPTWTVRSVHDGDTVTCRDTEGGSHKIRLLGIDAPEMAQAGGRESSDALSRKVAGRRVAVISRGYDHHGRLLGTLWIDDRDINREMVLDGQAWVFGGFAPDEELLAAEADARKGRRGLWSDSRPVSPAEWRSAHPSHR
jgi:endonuclease YncB( thermonuclease family)